MYNSFESFQISKRSGKAKNIKKEWVENYHDLNSSFEKTIDQECSSAVEADAYPDPAHDDNAPAATVADPDCERAAIECNYLFLRITLVPRPYLQLEFQVSRDTRMQWRQILAATSMNRNPIRKKSAKIHTRV